MFISSFGLYKVGLTAMSVSVSRTNPNVEPKKNNK